MISSVVGYYEIFGYNRETGNYDVWLGTATAAVAKKLNASIGGLVGYHKATPDGWACKAKR